MTIVLALLLLMVTFYAWIQWGRREIFKHNIKLLLGMSKTYLPASLYAEIMLEMKRLGP